jgi:mannose/cellobiose epimerase-like protein (N-acyl-D-glucosamine 2-epimerase family)
MKMFVFALLQKRVVELCRNKKTAKESNNMSETPENCITSKYFTQEDSLLGIVTKIDPAEASFVIRCRSGGEIQAKAGVTTNFTTLSNIDALNGDRMPNPPEYDPSKPSDQVRKYIREGDMLFIEGVDIQNDNVRRFDARTVTRLSDAKGNFYFENTHWWLTQMARLADQWLDDLFADRRTFEWDDFAELYRTNLNILGEPTDNVTQECATLSRLIYGLSSCYLLTGGERYLQAARAGVKYQRETFRSLSHNGQYCFWMFGKRKSNGVTESLISSENPDDLGTIPLYEQIYALAGLCQYYRITQDWEALEDIRRTVRSFQKFFWDDVETGREKGLTGTGGYFSHIDYATLRPDSDALGQNKLRKNWNSIGDHIPAYLVNLILALEPLPRGGEDHDSAEELLRVCKGMLEETSRLILTKFPDPNSKFVNERFHADWTPDHNWGWQQNRGIVGHNFKIAWNMTRVANYYRSQAAQCSPQNESRAVAQKDFAGDLEKLAQQLISNMSTAGIDQLRGGCFDAMERNPSGGLPMEFAWSNTKDFWQQEQAILAYLIVYGTTHDANHIQLAREMMAFWNHFFVDSANHGIYFRVEADGSPVIQGSYAQKAGHSVAGYHAFELNYLAHSYICTYVQPGPEKSEADKTFCLYFRPDAGARHTTLNVLPDFVPPNSLRIASITVNGVPRTNFSPDNFQIELHQHELGAQVIVEFAPMGGRS